MLLTASRSRREGAALARRWKLRRWKLQPWKPRRERPGQAARGDGDRRSGLRRPSPPRSAAPRPEGFARPRSDGPGLSGRRGQRRFGIVSEGSAARRRGCGQSLEAGWPQRALGAGRRNWRVGRVGSCRGLRVFWGIIRRGRAPAERLEGRRLREVRRSGGLCVASSIFCRFVGLRLRNLDGFAGQRGHLVGGTDATFRGRRGGGRKGPGRPWRRVL